MNISYRPDIDGLRAIAVLTVLIFHAFPTALPSGFIGVDIFFVISGYLISSIILSQLLKSRFSFIDFYTRRIRRIFPALLVVVSASLLAGWHLLFPDPLKSLGLHVSVGSIFGSNFLLLSEAGYFDVAAGEKPMLHLWSLSIEEQFYIVWPVLLAVFLRVGRSPMPIIALGGIASFIHGLLLIQSSNSAAFYLPTARFWELMMGAFIAYLHLLASQSPTGGNLKASQVAFSIARVIAHSKKFQTLLSLTGAALLSAGLCVIRSENGFPGWWALFPVGGTACIVAAGPKTFFNRYVLGNRALVFIGLISYPLYLWHWPLLTIGELAAPEALTPYERGALLCVSFILAWLTYHLVERPFRQGNHGIAKATVLVCCMASLGYCGWNVFSKDGYPRDLPPVVNQVLQFGFDHNKAYRRGVCFHDRPDVHKHFEACTNTPSNPAAPRVFLWGDSHAAHLYPGLSGVLGDRVALSQMTTSECSPLLIGEAIDPLCYKRNMEVITQIQSEKPDVVILAGNWVIKGREVSGYLTETLRTLKSSGPTKVIVIGQHPTWNRHVPLLLAQKVKGDPLHRLKGRLRGLLRIDPNKQDAILRPLVLEAGGIYISPNDILCNEDGCLALAGEAVDTLTTWDDAHLTTAGSLLIAERIQHDIP